jgi:hypothetical protein
MAMAPRLPVFPYRRLPAVAGRLGFATLLLILVLGMPGPGVVAQTADSFLGATSTLEDYNFDSVPDGGSGGGSSDSVDMQAAVLPLPADDCLSSTQDSTSLECEGMYATFWPWQ